MHGAPLSVDASEDERPRVSSLPSDFTLSLRGWTSDLTDENEIQAEAQAFANDLTVIVRSLSEIMDLSLLETVIVTTDYQGELDRLETGHGRGHTDRTSNEHGQGHAMAIHMNRNGKLRSAVILDLPLVRHMFSENPQERGWAMHTLRHELAHVDTDALHNSRAEAGPISMRCSDVRQSQIVPAVYTFQSEFRADYASAYLAPDLGEGKMNMLGSAIREFETWFPKRRALYCYNGDWDSFWIETEQKLSFLFRSLGYALGYTLGLEHGEEHPEVASKLRTELDALSMSDIGWLIAACEEEIRVYYTDEAYKSPSTFDGMVAIAERLLNQFEVYTWAPDNGFYISMSPNEGLDRI